MRKETIFKFIFPLFSIFFLLVISSCQIDTDPTYAVWTSTATYSEFEEVFGTLEHGYFLKFEKSDKDWDEDFAPVLELASSQKLTETEIKNWFISRGFGPIESSRETTWIISVNHGFIANRNGTSVYMIIK